MDCVNERRTHRIILRCAIPSAAGAMYARKSEGVIHDGTARTASMTPPLSSTASVNSPSCCGASSDSSCRYTCTTPSGRLVDPDLLLRVTKDARAGPDPTALLSLSRVRGSAFPVVLPLAVAFESVELVVVGAGCRSAILSNSRSSQSILMGPKR